MTSSNEPGIGIKAIGVFFLLASGIALTSGLSLCFPGGVLEWIWQINPRAHLSFAHLGTWSIALLAILSFVCLGTGIGLWRDRRWGYWSAVIIFGINLLGDLLNFLLGSEPRAIYGIPIVATLLAYLFSRKVRLHFRTEKTSGS